MTSADWHDFEQFWEGIDAELHALCDDVLAALRDVRVSPPPLHPERADLYHHSVDNMTTLAERFGPMLRSQRRRLDILILEIPHPVDPHTLLPRAVWEHLQRWWGSAWYDLRNCTAQLVMTSRVLEHCLQPAAGSLPAAVQTVQECVEALDDAVVESGRAGRIATDRILEEYED